MKTSSLLRKEALRCVLSSVLVLCVLFFTGCQKDPVEPPVKPPPADTEVVLKNGSSVITTDTIRQDFGSDFFGFYEIKNLKEGDVCAVTVNDIEVSHASTGTLVLTNLRESKRINFIVNGNTMKRFVFILVGENPNGTIGFTSIPADPIPYNTESAIGYIFTGDSCVITNNKNSNTSTVTVKSGLYNTGNLTEWTIFTFTVWKNGNSITGFAGVHVQPPPPPPTLKEYLIAHSWGIKEFFIKVYENDPWIPQSCAGVINEENFFYANNTRETWENGVLIGNGVYSVVDSTFQWGSDKWKFAKINDTVMIIVGKVPCLQCQTDSIFWKQIYKKFSSKKK